MTTVVFGASGLIGQYVLPRLATLGVDVTAVSRREHVGVPGVAWLRGALPAQVPVLPASVEAIVCVGPLDHFSHWLAQAAVIGQPAVVAMSSMSALSKRNSPLAGERELAARLRASEERLLACCAARGSTCTIVRATLIYGGAGGSLEKLAATARKRHVFPVPRGHGLRQPVHADDLAATVVAALQHPAGLGVVCAGGGERLAASAMFARVRTHLAPRTLALPVPAALIGLRAAQRGMAARLRVDLVADNTRLREQLGIVPRAFLS